MGPYMKKISTALLAAASVLALSQFASAADMSRPVYKAPPPVAPVWSWTGLYFGGHLGGAWADETVSTLGFGSAGIDPSGFLGGIQLGYNYQFHPNWLIGIEGDISWTNTDATTTTGALVATSSHNWYSTVAGRLGYVSGPWMIYGKGGGAWMDADYTMTTALGTSSLSETRGGWMAGVGLEWMFQPNWSAKVEWNYMDFGNDTYTFASTGAGTTIDTQINVIKAGINYKFF